MRAMLAALPSVLRQQAEERLFRMYVCDSMHYYPQNKYITQRFAEYLEPQKRDERTPAEILADIAERAGITIA